MKRMMLPGWLGETRVIGIAPPPPISSARAISFMRTVAMYRLRPGMAATAEIKTGKRRVIAYLLDPVLRFKEESFHER